MPRRRLLVRGTAWLRIAFVVGALVALAIAMLPRSQPAPPPPPTASVSSLIRAPAGPRPSAPPTVEFISGQQSVQLPVTVVELTNERVGDLPDFEQLVPTDGVLVSLARETTRPLDLSALKGQPVAVYTGADGRVSDIRRPPESQDPTAPDTAPYVLAIVVKQAMPFLSFIHIGDRVVTTVPTRSVELPPSGSTAEPYPIGVGPPESPLPTQPAVYPPP